MRLSIVDFPNILKTRNTRYYILLSVLDKLFSLLIVAPLVVSYWRSVWELMNVYVYPENRVSSACVSLTIGTVGHLLFMVPQHTFGKSLHPDRNRILYYITTRIFTFCYAFICVNAWRGLWEILDHYTEPEVGVVLAPTSAAVIILGVMRTLRNTTATPFFLAMDAPKGYFEAITMFKVPIKEKKTLYILDCLFSVVVIGNLSVFVWRGTWALMDILILPRDYAASALASLIIGYTVAAITFIVQPFVKWLCDRITGLARLLVADILLLFSVFGIINVWRGVWHLLNSHFLRDNITMSCWITFWFSIITLILLGCANTTLVRGVYIDGDEPGGKCTVFPCHYFRVIFQEEELNKLQKQHRKSDMPDEKPPEYNHNRNIQTISEDCEKGIGTDLKEENV